MISLKKATQRGFTIVELLIVIVVIGILAGLVITTYNGIQQKARNTERQTDLKAIQGQLEAYYATNGKYPDNNQLGSNGTTNVSFIGTDMRGLDKESLRDPKMAAGDYALSTSAPSAGTYQYAYLPVNDGGTACDNSAGGNDCTGYKLIANKEGSTDKIEYDSLN